MSKTVEENRRTFLEGDRFSIETGAVVSIEGESVQVTNQELGLLALVAESKNLPEMAAVI